ncbi:IclR family transcriptional regulator [Phytoactinopolyspora alkaliphila]|uniref:IclR family transcriptional regulator n=1 Tax=Phytoactinopolyspora alkaliphila TaxID=1783498 RepID=A0A6N9YJB3_9ACTN|nr:IclR family transcriptional regulator [Phytoactinopolyspora alkaliphila]NED94988.1 IclR family transcriptional regulator [Phytoactinopolyspora alkaliphila]
MKDDDPIAHLYTIRSVERVAAILGLIQEYPDGFDLEQVSAVTHLPEEAAHRYVATLLEHLYVSHDPRTGLFYMGPALVPHKARQHDVLAERIRPALAELRDQRGETVNFGVLEGHHVAYVAVAESPHQSGATATEGARDPIHSTALGKAVASILDHERITGILRAGGMPPSTPSTITRVSDYLDAVEDARARGYAMDDGENVTDARCIAIPVPGIGIPASISISAPVSRMPFEQLPGITWALRETARQVTAALTGIRD